MKWVPRCGVLGPVDSCPVPHSLPPRILDRSRHLGLRPLPTATLFSGLQMSSLSHFGHSSSQMPCKLATDSDLELQGFSRHNAPLLGGGKGQWKPPLRAERTRLCGPCSSHPFRSLVPPPLPVTVYNRPSSCAPLPRSDPASLVSWPSLQHGGLRAFACAVPSAPQWGSQGRVHSQYTGSPCTERLPLTP